MLSGEHFKIGFLMEVVVSLLDLTGHLTSPSTPIFLFKAQLQHADHTIILQMFIVHVLDITLFSFQRLSQGIP